MDKHPGGRPLKFKTVQALQKKIDEYFKLCDSRTTKVLLKNGKEVKVPDPRPYTVTGLALYLDTSRQTLLEYEGEVEGRDTKDPEFADAIKRAKQKCENYAEESLWQPKIATGIIFNLKNNYGWKDKTEVVDQTNTQKFDLEDIRALVSPLPPEEQQKFFEILTAALQRGEVPRGTEQVQPDSAQ